MNSAALAVAILVCCSLVATAADGTARKWTSRDGKFSIEAELLEVKNKRNALLKKSDGELILVPLGKLSEPDCEHIDAPLSYRERMDAKEKRAASATVTDTTLKELVALSRDSTAETLVLANTQVTDAGVKEVSRLSKVRFLFLSNTKVTDAGLKELAGLTSLQGLTLDNTQVTDAGMKELVGLVNLKGLGLINTEVTDKGLAELSRMKSLKYLDRRGTKVTATGIEELKKTLPDLKAY